MPQVSARIVVAQTGNPAPGGYAHGSRDGLLLDALVTLTNADNAGVTSWQWEIFAAVGLEEADYSVSGKESASCTLTPPASTGYGDLAVRLTVRGDPLPNGRANVAVAEALLGVRATLDGYEDGLPIVHPKESTLGGVLTLSALRGVIGRIAEALRAIKMVGVGGGPPSGTAGGDLGGSYPNPTVRRAARVIYHQGGTELLPGEYGSFSAALAAAQALPGLIDLFINGDDDPPVLPAGSHSLQHRIRLLGFSSLAVGLVPLDVSSGGQLVDACYLEGLELVGELAAPLFSSSSGPLDLTFVRCERSDLPEGDDLLALGSGINRLCAVESSFSTDGQPIATPDTGKHLTVIAERGSFFNNECFHGTAGTLTLQTDGTSVVETTDFSGTLVRQSGSSRAFRFQGVSGTQQSDPSDGTGWTTIGTVRIDPSNLASPAHATRSWELHADVEVVEASASTVQAEVRLLDASNTALGSMTSTLGGASTFPQHLSAILTAGTSDGQVKPTATTYLVQMRRQGGSPGDLALVHNAFVEVSWS